MVTVGEGGREKERRKGGGEGEGGEGDGGEGEGGEGDGGEGWEGRGRTEENEEREG